ncbi:alpha/beta hydrolase [Nonlabens ulvanivorans]|uniref:alpha/beta hydrolase n=1 Tax=Nonlabens ulvanivorans TaxID=906888 RepID=UPI00294253B8|nr:alpha/beta hydrolase [Nonlabens ulvanivorans]WOI23216.1 alpha/beta hydrolase [Nonlabens ulvanivorans]
MKFIKRLLVLVVVGYILICGWFYFCQENLLFFPEKLGQDHQFQFANEFTEKDLITPKGDTINTLLFKRENSKGVIFYLHRNDGSLKSVGNVSEHFLPLGYDVFMMDYQGYGKSSNVLESELELYDDIQFVYDYLKKSYYEDNIVVIGYSIGTGPAAYLTSQNNPKALVLHAPYYSMTDIMQRNYPVIPTFILRYDLVINEYLKNVKVPAYIFHGVDDTVIPVESSEMLSEEFDIPFYRLENQGHGGISSNVQALEQLSLILNA